MQIIYLKIIMLSYGFKFDIAFLSITAFQSASYKSTFIFLI